MQKEQDDLPELSLEESIALAEELKTKYSDLEKLNTDVANGKNRLSIPEDTGYKAYSRFRFFWPTLIIADVVFAVVAVIAIFIAAAAMNINTSDLSSIGYIPGGIAAGITILIGWNRAQDKASQANLQLENEKAARRKARTKLQSELQELKNEQTKLIKELEKYNSMIPLRFRNSSSISQVCVLLRNGSASNFTEAFNILIK